MLYFEFTKWALLLFPAVISARTQPKLSTPVVVNLTPTSKTAQTEPNSTTVVSNLTPISTTVNDEKRVNTLPLLWPVTAGTNRISSHQFQKTLYLQKEYFYLAWRKCVANCQSYEDHDWQMIARMDSKGVIRYGNGTDTLYALYTNGILEIRNVTVADNNTEYRSDVRTKSDYDTDYIMLVYFKEEGKTCPQSRRTASRPGISDSSAGGSENKTACKNSLLVTCESLNNCSSHGSCTGPNECTCEKGFQGAEDCSEVSCYPLNNCSSHGSCTGPNECTCEKGFQGEDCSEVSEGDGSFLSTPAGTASISVGLVVVALILGVVLIYYCKRQRGSSNRSLRKSSTEVYSSSHLPSSEWVFPTSSKPSSKVFSDPPPPPRRPPVFAYKNPAYEMNPLEE